MIRQTSAIALLVLVSYLLSSCSGAGGCAQNCGGNGNAATVSFTLTATPPNPGLNLSIQAFSTTITGITLLPSSGTAANLTLASNTYLAELNRVTADSTLLAAQVSVPAGNYSQVQVFFSAPRVTFCTQSNPGTPGCAAGTLVSVTGAAGSATISGNFSIGASQQTGFAINVNIGNALTLQGQNVSAVNLGANSVFSVNSLPSAETDLGSGQLSHLDDILGVVTSTSGSNVTLLTNTRGSITAVANSSTTYDASLCSSQSSACIEVGALAIVDGILNTDGTVSLAYYGPISSTSLDVVEGVVTAVPNSVSNQFPIVVTDYAFASSGSMLSGQVHIGDQISVTLNNPNPFQILAKGIQIAAGNAFLNSTNVAAIQPGQTVALPVATFTAQSGTTAGTATSQNLALRFTRFSAIMATPTSPQFSANTFPSYFGLSNNDLFQTTSGRLSLDGTSSLSSIASSSTISVSALYVDPLVAPQFSAQTVRAH